MIIQTAQVDSRHAQKCQQGEQVQLPMAHLSSHGIRDATSPTPQKLAEGSTDPGYESKRVRLGSNEKWPRKRYTGHVKRIPVPTLRFEVAPYVYTCEINEGRKSVCFGTYSAHTHLGH